MRTILANTRKIPEQIYYRTLSKVHLWELIYKREINLKTTEDRKKRQADEPKSLITFIFIRKIREKEIDLFTVDIFIYHVYRMKICV